MSGKIKIAISTFLMLAFMVLVSLGRDYKNLPLSELAEKLGESAKLSEMECFSGLRFKKDYSFAASDYDEVVYYGHEDLMHSECLLLVKGSEDKLLVLKEKIEELGREKAELFHSYAPDQYELLNSAGLKIFGNILIYSVSENSGEIVRETESFLR